jgi:hypothetical protein
MSMSTYFHGCGWAVPQIQCTPSIRWDRVQDNAPKPGTPTYAGHLPNGSGVQRHSADDAYAQHGIVMEAHEGRRRVWYAMKNGKMIAAHPRHDAARFMALAILTGA